MRIDNFFDWFASEQLTEQPWLLLGKGPSFQQYQPELNQHYFTLALNHTIREVKCDIAHAIDLDVIDSCADAIDSNARYLLVPWVLHQFNKPSDKTLNIWIEKIPILEKLWEERRLKWYNLRTTKIIEGKTPIVQAMAFSAEAAVSALALAGIRRFRTLGIDGGIEYAQQFSDLQRKTRLNNGQPSYDLQFKGICKSIRHFELDFGPLNTELPIRVYVGSQIEQMLAVKVLEYTLKKYASATVELHPLHLSDVYYPMPKHPENRPRTPFSFQRFSIPQMAGFKGKAIYLDSDMMVFTDIMKLWNIPFEGSQLLSAGFSGSENRDPQYSVMLLNCEQLKEWAPSHIVSLLDEGKLTYNELMYQMKIVNQQQASIPSCWNSLEAYEPGQTALLHFTDMNRQPWLSRKNSLTPIWVQALIDAVEDGFISLQTIQEHVDLGWVRPSLLWQVKKRKAHLSRYSFTAAWLDRQFIPPHKK